VSAHNAGEALKASPPGAVLGAYVMGYSINEWAAFAALLYTLMLIGEKLYTWHHKRKLHK